MNLKDAGIYDLTNIFKGEPTTCHNQSQGGIINGKNRIINIPAYQRPYRWPIERIDTLFQDYLESKGEYFLGSSVFVEKQKSRTDIEFDVVDGQQRITTLYLLNYIRYLIKRELYLYELSKPYQLKSSKYCEDLKRTYVGIVGKENKPFDSIINKIDELSNDEELDSESRMNELLDCYKRELCIPEKKMTEEDTNNEIIRSAESFFKNEQLCLKYTRDRYNNTLKESMISVYIKEDSAKIFCSLEAIGDYEGTNKEQYINAMKELFKNLWSDAINGPGHAYTNVHEVLKSMSDRSDEMLKNLSICVVLTESEQDAYKLFEVLNDRSLEVNDLELIKNHFYKEYCTKTKIDDENTIDKNITDLDITWTDKIFDGIGSTKSRLISFLSAVYFTCDSELSFKDDLKFKDSISRKYSDVYHQESIGYEYDEVKADFNVYYAIRIITDKFGLKMQKANDYSLNAEEMNYSITYRAVNLLNALKYHAVIPAIVNVIISSYTNEGNKLCDINFEKTFSEYIDGIINDTNHTDIRFKKIHDCSYSLWTAAIKSEDYVMVRDIAKRIINKYGYNRFSKDDICLTSIEFSDLNDSFDKWLSDWSYGTSKDFVIKVLLLKLLLTNRIPQQNGYKQTTVKLLDDSSLTYKLIAADIQLDHLEACNPPGGSSYFSYNDLDNRKMYVDKCLGNFMILDAKDNNRKNNVPMIDAITTYYKKIEKSWLLEDIIAMSGDNKYFNTTISVPKEDFFKLREKHLKTYFKAYMNKKLNDKEVVVNL